MSWCIKIGIMGGRLSNQIGEEIQAFPIYSWKREFEKAQKCGFELIEWVFDLYKRNPILYDEGIKEMRYLSEKHQVKINAVCADYFMKKKLFNVSKFELEKNLNALKNLIQKCNKLEIEILELPLVDSSSVKRKRDQDQLIFNLQKIVNLSDENNVTLTLETDLPPQLFKEFLSRIDHPCVKANYDSGNSASLGYDVKEELNILGPWIKNIHVKDRIYKGRTVPLGRGDTNFELFFSTLSNIHYSQDLIIQGAREPISRTTPEETCKKYLEFVKQYVDKYLLVTDDKCQRKKG